MSSWDKLAGLPVQIDDYELEGLEAVLRPRVHAPQHDRPPARRRRDRRGRGRGLRRVGPRRTSRRRARARPRRRAHARLVRRAARHARPVPGPAEPRGLRNYRRWAFESAALDLALRQGGKSLGDVLGANAAAAHVRRLDAARGDGLRGARDQRAPAARCSSAYPGTRFKLDPTNTWTPELIAELVATGAVDSLDLKGKYKGTPVDVDTDPELYRDAGRVVPGRLARGPGPRRRRRPRRCSSPTGPHHLGRADPLGRRHRGAAVPAEDGEHQAVALRPAGGSVRRLRLLRGAGHRRLRRRAVRARRRPRPHPVPRLADAPGHAERHGAEGVQPARAARRGCPRARSSRRSRRRASASPDGYSDRPTASRALAGSS